MSNNMAEKPLENMAEKTPENMAEKIPENMAEKIPENMAEKTPENMVGKNECSVVIAEHIDSITHCAINGKNECSVVITEHIDSITHCAINGKNECSVVITEHIDSITHCAINGIIGGGTLSVLLGDIKNDKFQFSTCGAVGGFLCGMFLNTEGGIETVVGTMGYCIYGNFVLPMIMGPKKYWDVETDDRARKIVIGLTVFGGLMGSPSRSKGKIGRTRIGKINKDIINGIVGYGLGTIGCYLLGKYDPKIGIVGGVTCGILGMEWLRTNQWI